MSQVLWVSQLRCDTMDENQWNAWCRDVVKRLTNVEKTLTIIDKRQKRMLYVVLVGFVAVLSNGLLLFYK